MKKYSRAKAERIIRLIEQGYYDYQAAKAEGVCSRTIYQWKRDHDWFKEDYLIADEVRILGWLEQADARLADPTRDKVQVGSYTVQRDKNLADFRLRCAALRRPDKFTAKGVEVSVGVTVKRVVVVEKFDGAKIKRFAEN